MNPYDYSHRFGVRRISWNDFARLAAHLAELIEPFQPQIILGNARAGLFPATFVACSLRRELYPVRLTRRYNDEVIVDQPDWKVPVPAAVAGQVVAVVDEIASSGQTLAMITERALNLGAAQVVTASLVSHSWAEPAPQITALTSDEFIIFPWDRRILTNGKWVIHPEVQAGLRAQKHKG